MTTTGVRGGGDTPATAAARSNRSRTDGPRRSDPDLDPGAGLGDPASTVNASDGVLLFAAVFAPVFALVLVLAVAVALADVDVTASLATAAAPSPRRNGVGLLRILLASFKSRWRSILLERSPSLCTATAAVLKGAGADGDAAASRRARVRGSASRSRIELIIAAPKRTVAQKVRTRDEREEGEEGEEDEEDEEGEQGEEKGKEKDLRTRKRART